jgi:hypothetical protein
MTSKAREYRASAARCEAKANKQRTRAEREWQMILARAYQKLAEAEVEAAALGQSPAGSRQFHCQASLRADLFRRTGQASGREHRRGAGELASGRRITYADSSAAT